MPGDPAVGLALRGVRKSYDGRAALDIDVLEVTPRTTVALIGPSGSGKSTLLRLVVGLLAPERGEILIGDTPMDAEHRRALRLRMGYVIQEGGLFPHLTAAGNVSLVARDIGWDGVRIAARVHELADLVRLPRELLGRHPAQLSGGQRQRVGLMRALMLDPALLLMDEPLGSLDPMIRSELQTELRDLFRRLRKTVLLVTHDMAEAVFLGDEIVLLRQGRIVQRGAPLELLQRPSDPFVSAFVRAQRLLTEGAAAR